jgi:hypothetical protein
MSTDWYYRFRAALRPDLKNLDLDELVERAPGELAGIDFPTHLWINDTDAVSPVIGPHTSCDGSRFRGHAGAFTEDGELLLGIWCQNLEREVADPGDEFREGLTGLGLLLGFLTWATVGPPGEIVGCIASQRTHFWHADPLVRCPDGRIRVADTEPRYRDGCHDGAEPTVVDIPLTIPVEHLRVVDRTRAGIDAAGLRARFAPIDGIPGLRAIPMPRSVRLELSHANG